MDATATFSEKEKKYNDEIIMAKDTLNISILENFTLPLPSKLEELKNDGYLGCEFFIKYIKPKLNKYYEEVWRIDDYKVILCDDKVILVAMIKDLAYINDLSDDKDTGKMVKLSTRPDIKTNYDCRFSTFKKIKKHTYFAVARSKFHGLREVAMDGCNIINIAKKKITIVPVKFDAKSHLVCVHNNDIEITDTTIKLKCSLTHDVRKYIEECHDIPYEGRTITWDDYTRDCEINIENW